MLAHPDTFRPLEGSRFYRRWLSAQPEREAKVQNLAQLSLSSANLVELLQLDSDYLHNLPRAMRRLRNLTLAILIERDLSRRADLNEVMTTISDLADLAIRTHLSTLMLEMCQSHGVPIGHESGLPQEMIVLGMGKLGGLELNVSSDIDLIFLYPEDGDTRTDQADQRPLSNQEFFVRLGRKLIAALSEVIEEGFTFRVDMALRPNGGSGPLAASFGMLEEYFIVQGREWERYAWIKARAITGHSRDIETLTRIVHPFVYRRYLDFGSIDALRSMHAQIRAEVNRQEARRPERRHNVKLGRGGIREIEFIAQLFQLIRGGRDPELRDRSTRNTLRTLSRKQLLAHEAVEILLESYEFLRNLEHRIQYLDDAQTHTLPVDEHDRHIIAVAMGYDDSAQLMSALEYHTSRVATQFDQIFSDKQGNATESRTDAVEVADLLDSAPERDEVAANEALTAQLAAYGIEPAEEAARRLSASLHAPRMVSLPETSRTRLLKLVQSALDCVRSHPHDRLATLVRVLDFFETVARRAAYLALLTEYPHTLARVVRMMNASEWAARYLTRHPILLDELLDETSLFAPPDWSNFSNECLHQLGSAQGDTERQMDILRELHHAQLLHLLVQDLEGGLTVETLADHLSQLADILIEHTLNAVWQTLPKRHRERPQFSVIAYGKLGGKELGYASDLDLIFLYDDDDQDAPALYAKLAQRFITWMTCHTPAGILFDVDIALRPNGASGLMVSSVSAFERYQLESAWPWEHQALTRARFCSGDSAIGARFEAIRERVLRMPRAPDPLCKEVRAMRQRMAEAHPNPTTLFDLKHDRGGMIDIEFIVQTLVLCHAHRWPELTADIGNIALLGLAGRLGLVNEELSLSVADAYRRYRKLQHQARLQGDERARVSVDLVAEHIEPVCQLWEQVLGSDAEPSI